MTLKNVSAFHCDGFRTQDIYIQNDLFVPTPQPGDDSLDCTDLIAIPGLIDVHTHGCIGNDYSSADSHGIALMANYQASHGITTVFPTVASMPGEELSQACQRLSKQSFQIGSHFPGIHIEGPFFSKDKAGALNPSSFIDPDPQIFLSWQEDCQGAISLMSMAPECPNAIETIRALQDTIKISLGHTVAGYEITKKAFQAGASQLTHTFNAMSPFSHRDPGPIGAALDSPGCYPQLIGDGVHVHPTCVRALFQMFGEDRILLISDSMMATGLNDGLYTLASSAVTVKGNRATLTGTNVLAGSVSNLFDCLRSVLSMGIGEVAAVKSASVNPAKAMGIFDTTGSIDLGKQADLVLVNQKWEILSVYCSGRRISASKEEE
jgi:N-acetylglucosamine-6-phosphate deacetylase